MGTLYLVSTPIGNLEDLSPRAARVLGEVGLILAEDTRRTRGLLSHLGLSTPLASLHAHNEQSRAPEVLERLESGQSLAVVSDAGTPLVSDPGERLLSRVIEAGHDVVPLPGPSAVLAALAASGLPAVPFTFLGFPPRKGKERREWLDVAADAPGTLVAFESPHRTGALLSDLADRCGARRNAVVGRELTKVYEEFRRGTLEDLASYYLDDPPRGEVTVVVAPGARTAGGREVDRVACRVLATALIAQGASPSRAAKECAARLDIPKNLAYEIVLALRSEGEGAVASGEDPMA